MDMMGSTPEAKQSQVNEQTTELQGAIGNLESNIDELEKRLEPILRTMLPDPEVKVGTPEISLVGHAERLREQNRRVFRLAVRIKNMIHRCEL
jgi:hypothetical protein